MRYLYNIDIAAVKPTLPTTQTAQRASTAGAAEETFRRAAAAKPSESRLSCQKEKRSMLEASE